jgi:hypothetical protein
MEEGKEFMRSFGDLLQYHQKKKEQDSPEAESKGVATAPPAPAHGSTNAPSNGSKDESHESPVMSGEVTESGS